jgi:hypothetical protein
MLGFFSCAEEGSDTASPSTVRNAAATRTDLTMRFMNVLLFSGLRKKNR